MNIDAIAAIAPSGAAAAQAAGAGSLLQVAGPPAPQTEASEASSPADFGTWMARQVAGTDAALTRAEAGVQRVALGDASNLHGVMIDLEQARLSFQLLAQVRTRVLEAYQEVARMQV